MTASAIPAYEDTVNFPSLTGGGTSILRLWMPVMLIGGGALSAQQFSASEIHGEPSLFCELPDATTDSRSAGLDADLTERGVSAGELSAWARSMMGGDTAHMLDI